MKAYYNEFDPKAAAWIRELIKEGLIADGSVDERSITDVQASDLVGFAQCHFFAGIGGWSYALRLAGIPDEYPLWTASLPCQPFSTAGKQKGKEDERHLLPHFLELVRQCQPNAIFGEQVEGAIRHGWLDDLQTTMEAEGYAVGHCVLGAHSIGSFHQRQRLYWVANTKSKRGCWRKPVEERRYQEFGRSSEDGGMGITNSNRCESRSETTKIAGYRSPADSAGWNDPEWLYCRDNKYRPIKPGIKPLVNGVPRGMVYSGGEIYANDSGIARNIRLKGYGNAIVPQVAAEFISAFFDTISMHEFEKEFL